MKTILVKMKAEDAKGYDGDVYIPLKTDLEDLPYGELNVEFVHNKKRTLTQNRAIHKYLNMLSEDLNGAGYDMKAVIKDDVDIPWSEGNAKEFLWRPIQKAMGLPDSTTELKTKEVSQVYEVLSRHMAQKFGITTPFPSR